RPGVVLASAARAYLNRFGVLPGRRAVVFTNNDGAYATAIDLAKAGARITVADARATLPARVARRCADAAIELRAGHAVAAVHGRGHVAGVALAALDGSGGHDLACDLVCVS